MISFDLKSLFTIVPLDKTIEFILKKVYEKKKKKNQTNISKLVLKDYHIFELNSYISFSITISLYNVTM